MNLIDLKERGYSEIYPELEYKKANVAGVSWNFLQFIDNASVPFFNVLKVCLYFLKVLPD